MHEDNKNENESINIFGTDFYLFTQLIYHKLDKTPLEINRNVF